MAREVLVHGVAVAVAIDPDGPLVGALLLGRSGAGKTSFAMALIEGCPWRRSALIADDGVRLMTRSGRIIARAPETISGLIEIRGFGPVRVRSVAAAPVIAGFDFDLATARLPEPQMRDFEGIELAVWPLDADGSGDRTRAANAFRAVLRSIMGGQTP